MLRVAQDIVTFAVSRKIADPLLFVKNTFQPDFDPQNLYENEKVVVTQAQTNTDLFYQFDDFIAAKQKKVSPGLLSCFNASKECLLAYQHHTGTPITFESFDFAFSSRGRTGCNLPEPGRNNPHLSIGPFRTERL